jgi:hypothetical protein
LGKDSDEVRAYKETLSKEHDKGFAYRFFYKQATTGMLISRPSEPPRA